MTQFEVNHNSNIGSLAARFENVSAEITKSPLVTKKQYEKIRDISLDIFVAKRELEQTIQTLKDQNKDVSQLEQLSTKLQVLSTKVESLRKQLPHTFAAKDNRSLAERIIDSTAGAVVNSLNGALRGQIFLGAKRNKADKALSYRLNKADNEHLSICKKAAKQVEKLSKLTKAHKEESEKPAPNQKRMDQLKTSMENCTKEINSLTQKSYAISTQKAHLSEKIKKNAELASKGDEMRASCRTLGGERVTITTPDSVKLDGMYLDAQKFRENLQNAGCRLVTLKTNDPLADSSHLQAIRLSKQDYAKSGEKVLAALDNLHAFASENYAGAGWQVVFDGDDLLLVRASELPAHGSEEANAHPFVTYNPSEKRWEIKQDRIHVRSAPEDIAQSRAAGTVIISSGNAGVYEQHKTEAAFFLLRNMNVMMFNFRGYGASEGDPTEAGLKMDMESAYQYAKERSEHPDRQILFKALCMSGGPAAYVSSKHPETNIMLDQTYSNFKTVVRENAKEQAETVVKGLLGSNTQGVRKEVAKRLEPLIVSLAGQFASLIAPDFQTAKGLEGNKGQKAILYTHDDTLMDLRHVEGNIRAAASAGKMVNLTIIAGPGEHAASFVGMETSPGDFAVKEKATLKKQIKELRQKRDGLLEHAAKVREAGEKEYQELRKAGHAFKNTNPDLHTMRRNQAREKRNAAENIALGFDKLAADVQKDINKLHLKRKEIEGKTSASGQNQIDLFLNKAHLSQDILQTDMPQKKLIRTAGEFTNAIESLRSLRDQLGLAGKSVITMEAADGGYLVNAFGQNGEEANIFVSNALIEETFKSEEKLKILEELSNKFSKRGLLNSESQQANQALLQEMKKLTVRMKDAYGQCEAQKIEDLKGQAHGFERQIYGEEEQYLALIDTFKAGEQDYISAPNGNKQKKLELYISKIPLVLKMYDDNINALKEIKSELSKIISGDMSKNQETKELEIEEVSNRLDRLIVSYETRNAELRDAQQSMETSLQIFPRIQKVRETVDSLRPGFEFTVSRGNAFLAKSEKLSRQMYVRDLPKYETDFNQLHRDIMNFKADADVDLANLNQFASEMAESVKHDDTLTDDQKKYLIKVVKSETEQVMQKIESVCANCDEVIASYGNARELIDTVRGHMAHLAHTKNDEEISGTATQLVFDMQKLEKMTMVPAAIVFDLRTQVAKYTEE